MKDIHIGQMINNKMRELRVSRVDMSYKLRMTRQHIHYIVKQKGMSTNLLQKICEALNYDFFQHYSTTKDEEVNRQNALQKENGELRTEIQRLEKELLEAKAVLASNERIIKLLGGK